MPDEPEPQPRRKPETDDELRKVLAGLSAKLGGDTDKVAMRLIRMNNDLGTKLTAAEARATTAEAKAKDAETKIKEAEDKAKSVVPADHVIVPKADVDTLTAYKALGEPTAIKETIDSLTAYKALGDPKAIKESLDRLPVVEKSIKDRERKDELTAVATTAGYAPSVFNRVVTDAMKFNPTKVKAAGKEIDTFEVVELDPETGKERKRALADVEASDWKDVLPALKPPPTEEPRSRPLPKGNSPYRSEVRVRPPAEVPSSRPPTTQEINRAAIIGAGIGI